jgi:hypothetical protein
MLQFQDEQRGLAGPQRLCFGGQRSTGTLPGKALKGMAIGLAMLAPLCAKAFNCGPNLLTYTATISDGSSDSIRCVSYEYMGQDALGAPFYTFSWYGEGRTRQGDIYRTVGVVVPPFPEGPFNAADTVASAANLSGNGEALPTVAIRSIKPLVTEHSPAPSVITMTGAMTQTWRLTPNANYSPLPLFSNCGPNLTKYEVRSPVSTGPGPNVTGVRCLFTPEYPNVWVGVQNGVLQLGAALTQSGNSLWLGRSDDLCNGGVAQTCPTRPAWSLSFTHTADGLGYHVLGALDEYWLIPGTYVPPPPPRQPPVDPCETRPWMKICRNR